MSKRYQYVRCSLCGVQNTSKNMMHYSSYRDWMCRALALCSERQRQNDINQEVITMTENPTRLREMAERLMAQADEVELKLASMPREPGPFPLADATSHNAPVIIFQKQFRTGGKIYSYAAIGCMNRQAAYDWYTTGPQQSGRTWTWNELMEWIGEEMWDTIDVVYGTPR